MQSQKRGFRTLKPLHPMSRRAVEKRTREAVNRLVKTMQINARLARKFGLLIEVKREKLPASINREIQAIRRRIGFTNKPPRRIKRK